MTAKYSLLSEIEPTDKQLDDLMKAVVVDVKMRAKLASEKFKTLQITQILEAKERFKNRNNIND